MVIYAHLFFFFCFCCTYFITGLQQKDIRPENIVQLASETFMKLCDKNANGHVTDKELNSCFEQLKRNNLANEENTVDSLMFFFDKNKDKKISLKEYTSTLKEAIRDKIKTGDIESDDAEYFEKKVKVTTRDGKTKMVSQIEMLEMMKQNMAEFGDMEADSEGRYFKDDHGKKSLEQLSKDNPQLSRFIDIGKWSLRLLLPILNATNATLAQLRSLPIGGSPNRGQDAVNSGLFSPEDHEAWLEMAAMVESIDDNNETLTKRVSIEIHIVKVHITTGNRNNSHLKLAHAWLLDASGNRIETLSIPNTVTANTTDTGHAGDMVSRLQAIVNSKEFVIVRWLMVALATAAAMMFVSLVLKGAK